MHGRNKLLVKVEGKTIIRRVVEAGLKSKVNEVIVVLGWEAERVKAAIGDLPCQFALNENYENGQSSSVKAGLKKVGEKTQAILVLPGDIAMINSQSINLVIDEYARRKARIIIASHDKQPGHPILLARQLFPEIGDINETTFGLKAVVRNHKADVAFVEAGSTSVLRDVDSETDLKRLLHTSPK